MRNLKNYLVLALLTVLILPLRSFSQGVTYTEADKIKQAHKYYESKEYAKALPLYSQIVSNDPSNVFYNYYLGVCLLKVDGDKADAVRFLTIAIKSTEVPINAWLYLGMALHQAYRFDEAISILETFRKSAGKQSWKESGGEGLINMCRNAINLNNDLSLVRHSILEEYECSSADYVSRYKNIALAGRFLKLPKEYEFKQGKEKTEGSMLFLAGNGNMMVYAAPGKTAEAGIDIYKVVKDNNGLWKFPELISPVINSTADEAYPVLVNDGSTLYFSSNGLKSSGGYDIFRSDFNSETAKWSEPIPMGSPVNSPGNDFYYVPLTGTQTTYFTSDRESPAGKYKVYTASLIDDNRKFVAIDGSFVCPAGLDLSDAKVTILNSDDRSLLAQFRTSTNNGTYFLKLPVPSVLIYQVKVPGFTETETEVTLNDGNTLKLLQEIVLKRNEKGTEEIKITTKIPDVATPLALKKAEVSTSDANTELPLVSIINSKEQGVSGNEKQSATESKTELPLVSIVNTKEQAATGNEKQTAVESKTELTLVSIINTDVQAAAGNEKQGTAESKTELPLVSIINTETEKTVHVNENSEQPEVIAIVEQKDVVIVTPDPVSTDKIFNSEFQNAAINEPLVSIVNVNTTTSTENTVAVSKDIIPPVSTVTPGNLPETISENIIPETVAQPRVSPVATHQETVSEKSVVTHQKKNKRSAKNETPEMIISEKSIAPVAATTVQNNKIEDVVFRVQLGAFCNRTESELRKKFESTGITGLEFLNNQEGLLVVVTGNQSTYESAIKLKETIIQQGVKDAFIVVYSGADRLPVSMVVFEEE